VQARPACKVKFLIPWLAEGILGSKEKGNQVSTVIRVKVAQEDEINVMNRYSSFRQSP
jgi:hypothetical protein